MAASHRQAALDALNGNANLRVIDGGARNVSPPYVVVYVYVPGEARATMNGPTDETHVTIVTHSTASSGAGVDIVARQVRSTLLDTRLVVDGYVCSRIEHATGSPPDWDDSTGVVVMAQVDQWDYIARPA